MNKKPELAGVIEQFFPIFNAGNNLPAYKLRALNALQYCRTEHMGGHIEACQDCGEIRVAYNSCRNRNCPKCGSIEKEKWILSREEDLLPVRYFHVVFTVPDKLNPLFMENQVAMYNLLFKVSWGVLNDFGKTGKWIGGKIGATAILHTWGQNLHYHPHIHFIVPAGALMPNQQWKHSRQRGKYLFSVKQVSKVFRARFVEQLREKIKEGGIQGKLTGDLFDKDWVVYAKRPFGGPKQVINYLGRYTHRTAISNDRIVDIGNGHVTFTWKDYRNNYAQKTTALPGEKFLKLFCMHISPPGFTRIRHYGFLSSASKNKSVPIIRESLNKNKQPVQELVDGKTLQQKVFEKMGINPGYCRSCGGKVIILEVFKNKFKKKQRPPPKGPKPYNPTITNKPIV